MTADPGAGTGDQGVGTSERPVFGVNVGWLSRGGAPPAQAAADAEEAGFDVVTAADHVGRTGPLVALAAAAAVTSRVRLRTYVLDHGFWNPGLLARDIATLDALSGGRVDLGLGLGHMRHEHVDVGLPFPPYAERLDRFAAFVGEVRERLAGDGVDPRPVQRPVPLLVAAMGPRGLSLAARLADVVGVSGLIQLPGRRAGTMRLASSAETDERVEVVARERERLGLPPARLDLLLQQVVVDRDPQQVADEWAAEPDAPWTAADVLDSPFVLFATSPQEAAAEVRRRSARWGVTSWCTHAPSGPALAAVIPHTR